MSKKNQNKTSSENNKTDFQKIHESPSPSAAQVHKKKTVSRKKILGIAGISMLAFVVISLIMLGILLEPAIKIQGFMSFDADTWVEESKTVILLNDEDNAVSGKLLAENRIFVSINEVPQHTIDAFISIEDKRFYAHKGVDYKRIMSATKRNIGAKSYKEGASTITQQLVKNTHLTHDKTIARKIQEARIARSIERKYTKAEILENYFNILYFGNNLYGIGSATRTMFGGSVSELSIAQSALLAAIINNPAKYNPYQNPENAKMRRDLVLAQMFNDNRISQTEYQLALAEEIHMMPVTLGKNHYFGAVVGEAAKALGCSEKELFKRNVTIATHLDVDVQKKIEKIVQANPLDSNHLNMQILTLCNHSGSILSVNGFSDTRLVKIKRQPGSTIKPVLCFAPSLEKGIALPSTPILDEKTNFADYAPSNYRNHYDGWTNVENALAQSSNVVAVKLLEMIGVEYAKNFARNCGLSFSASDHALPLALGAMQEGVTLRQIVSSYQPFANEGKRIDSNFVRYIKDASGKVIYRAKATETRVMCDITAYFMNVMLQKSVTDGTARVLHDSGLLSVCAKTGTVGNADGNTDAYCIAYTPDYTVGIWIGAKNNHAPHTLTGGATPTLLAREVLKTLHKNSTSHTTTFNRPKTIKTVNVDAKELNDNHRLVQANDTLPLRFTKQIEYPSTRILPKKTKTHINICA